MPSLLGLLKNIDLALRAWSRGLVIIFKKASELRHYPIYPFDTPVTYDSVALCIQIVWSADGAAESFSRN